MNWKRLTQKGKQIIEIKGFMLSNLWPLWKNNRLFYALLDDFMELPIHQQTNNILFGHVRQLPRKYILQSYQPEKPEEKASIKINSIARVYIEVFQFIKQTSSNKKLTIKDCKKNIHN
jgi:hypothetical protein